MVRKEMTEHANLGNKSKAQLIELVKKLSAENEILKEVHRHMEITNTRLEKIEREQFKQQQYSRRDTVEICGIPSTILQENLEKEVVQIYAKAKVKVHGKPLEEFDIQACHRIGNKVTTICKFVNLLEAE